VGNRRSNEPVLDRFVEFVRKGFALLDEKSQDEVRNFVKQQQYENGEFTDRAGHPDLYYSLFGAWLSVGLELTEVTEKHKSFICEKPVENKSVIDFFASLLIKRLFFGKEFHYPSFFVLLRRAFASGLRVSIFYRLFLFFMTYDALYRNKIIHWFGRIFLFCYTPPKHSPCSIWAAFAVARRQAGLNIKKEEEILLSYFDGSGGFKAFRNLKNPDMLSTAVAFFSLKMGGVDLRLFAPGCFKFIEQNYREGAFLAGDGDETRDLEYTFYGLLALGTLSSV
jgi:hypothetical protein